MPLGLFGKYPAKRDYVSVNMPRSLLQPLEKWLAAALATSRDRMGRRWQEFYMVQPIWSFKIGASVAGVECLGVIAPSVDAVGRAFPLVIVGYGGSPDQRLAKADSDMLPWLEKANACLLLALSDAPPGEAADLLADLHEPVFTSLQMPSGVTVDGKGYVALWGEEAANQAMSRISALHQALADDHRSFWWCAGSGQVAPQTVSYDGFPDPGFGVRMMTSAASQSDASGTGTD